MGTQTSENHPQLSWSTCSGPGQCQTQNGKVTIDANWRWTHKKGETTNCYTGNKWDQTLCPDAKTYTVNGNQHKTITDDYCADWVAETQDGTNFLDKGGLGKIEAIDAGVVLVMSLWDDHYANMLWLDSTYPVDSSDPGAARGPCATSSGVPADVESQQANAHVIFSDIKVGPIGSTVPGPTPSPTPVPPTPSPSPTPSDCPGGSLNNCIDLCPADVFAQCVESCKRRCAGVLV